MGKVSIGLRGWRFEEDDIFDASGNLVNLEEMTADARHRLIRLSAIVGDPCDACWLLHGDENIETANVSTVVYGEPLAEVVVCDEHEPDLVYWFREEGGAEYAGSSEFPDAFHEWFLEGNRAPEGYAGLRYVQDDPDLLSDLGPDTDGITEVEEQVEDLDEDLDEDGAAALDLDLDSLDV